MKNKFYYIFCCIVLFFFSSCKNEPELGPPDEEFVGTYLVRDVTGVVDEQLKDSVVFSVQKQTTFSMLFYSLVNGGDIDMCNCGGTILDFGTGKVSFDASSNTVTGGCQIRSPGGVFAADFINFPGEIHITRSVQGNHPDGTPYDSLYELILKQ